MHLKRFLLVAVFLLHFNVANAQQFNWAKSFGEISFDESYTLTLNNNCVYIGGLFNGTVDFDPSPAVYDLSATGQSSSEAFVLKLDSAGNFLSAFSFGGNGNEEVRSIKVDDMKNIYVTGTYNDTADFDPGPNVFNLFPSGNESVFIAKYDSIGALI